MSRVMRSVKNVTKGYSNVQVKVREGMAAPVFSRVMEAATPLGQSELTTHHFPQRPATIHGALPGRR